MMETNPTYLLFKMKEMVKEKDHEHLPIIRKEIVLILQAQTFPPNQSICYS
jgi:hypothetical protein